MIVMFVAQFSTTTRRIHNLQLDCMREGEEGQVGGGWWWKKTITWLAFSFINLLSLCLVSCTEVNLEHLLWARKVGRKNCNFNAWRRILNTLPAWRKKSFRLHAVLRHRRVIEYKLNFSQQMDFAKGFSSSGCSAYPSCPPPPLLQSDEISIGLIYALKSISGK